MSDATMNEKIVQMAWKIKDEEKLYVLMSIATRNPYVECAEDTYDDQVFLYFTEQEATDAVRELRQKGIPVAAAGMEKAQRLGFFTSLYTMGVNALRVQDGAAVAVLQLDQIVKRSQPKDEPDKAIWVENPALHLTALYLMQELRSQQTPEQRQKKAAWVRELQEEISADFRTGNYIMPLAKEGNGIPLVIPANQEDKYQPVFTDVLEFQKFNKEGKLRPAVVQADKLPQALVSEAKGMVLNPMGVNMPLQVGRTPQQAI